MRSGIRFQLGLALTGLFALAFLPLLFAVSSLSRLSHRAAEREHALSLARVVAVSAASAIDAETAARFVRPTDSIAFYDQTGAKLLAAGRDGERLPTRISISERVEQREGSTFATVPHARGAVLLQTSLTAGRSSLVVRFVGLYALVVIVALLAFGYAMIGRAVVLPLDQLSQGARRVIDGARTLPRLASGARELRELSSSVADMTEKLRLEEEALRSKVDELVKVTAELRTSQAHLVKSERLASVGRLSAGLAHEVGNPLAALLGLQDLLLDGGLSDDEQRDFIERMRKETERIHKIVRDLLAFARGDAASETTTDEPGEVARAASEVVALLAPQRSMQDRELALDLEVDLPRVKMPHGQLVQVLLNLVLNAAEATGEGGHVTLSAKQIGGHVVAHVDDDGPGIDPSVQSSLFEPFVTTKDVGKGTGLGLAVCRGLVEAAGGTIACDRSPAGGARFTLELPLA